MAGIFDVIGAGSIGEGLSKLTSTPPQYPSASDAHNAAMIAKGMVRDPSGNWVPRLGAPQATTTTTKPVMPTAMPAAPVVPPANPLEGTGVEEDFSSVGKTKTKNYISNPFSTNS